jgi:hypothetical protein
MVNCIIWRIIMRKANFFFTYLHFLFKFPLFRHYPELQGKLPRICIGQQPPEESMAGAFK